MVVDVHAHFIPADQLTALRRSRAGGVGRDGEVVTLRLGSHMQRFGRDFTSVESVLESMDRRGIDQSLLSVVPPTYGYRLAPHITEDLSRAANHGLATAAEHSRLGWFATIPLNDPPRAVRVLTDALHDGAAGVAIGTNVGGINLDEPHVDEFFAAAEALRAPILIHGEDVLAPERLARHYLTNLAGNPYEAGLAVASLILGGVLDRHPNLRVCVCHGGGTTTAVIGRWDHAWREDRLGGTHLPAPPSSYLRRLWFDTLSHSERALRLLVELAGPDRIIFGSDAPFPMGDLRHAGWIDDIQWLSQVERAGIAKKNADTLLAR